jgi:ABC-type uncharacterized transport system substrate-binding protein
MSDRTRSRLPTTHLIVDIWEEVIGFVDQSGLPGMYQTREAVAAGGLISYGPDLPDLFLRGASYVDRVLQGAKPADLADPAKARTLVRQFDSHINDQAHQLMVTWWYRIVPMRSYVKGWTISPSHCLNQDLANIWLEE